MTIQKKCIKCHDPIIDPTGNHQLLCAKCREERKSKPDPVPKILNRNEDTMEIVTKPESIPVPEPKISTKSIFSLAQSVLSTVGVSVITIIHNDITITISSK